MSMTANSEGYARHMDEVFAETREDMSICDQLEAEYRYLEYLKHRRTFVSDEQPETENPKTA